MQNDLLTGKKPRSRKPYTRSGESGTGQPQHCRCHFVQTGPPLPLMFTWLFTLAASKCDSVLDATLDNRKVKQSIPPHCDSSSGTLCSGNIASAMSVKKKR